MIIIKFNLSAQTTNPCGTIAKISPSNVDSVVPYGTFLELSSLSINTLNYEWYINGFSTGISNSNLTYWIEAGVYKISLVARNGNCSDTATVVYFSAGTYHNTDTLKIAAYGSYNYNEEPVCFSSTKDSGMILAGTRYTWGYPCYGAEVGIITKLKKNGCLDWAKQFRFPSINTCASAIIDNVVQSTDSSIYVVTSNNTTLSRLNKNGEVIWNKEYFRNGLKIAILKPSADTYGNILFASYHFEDSLIAILKLDSNGNIIWSKQYQIPYNPDNNQNYPRQNIFSTMLIDTSFYIATAFEYSTNTNNQSTSIVSFNSNTGLKNWSYAYQNPNYGSGAAFFSHITPFGKNILTNSPTNGSLSTVVKNNGDVIKSFRTRFTQQYGPKNSRVAVTNEGRICQLQWQERTLPLQPYFQYYTSICLIDTALNKYWGNMISNYGRAYYLDVLKTESNKINFLGKDFGKVDDGVFSSRDMWVITIDTSIKEDLSCYDVDNTFEIYPENYNKFPLEFRNLTTFSVEQQNSINYYTIGDNIQSRIQCPDMMDSCSFMRISGPSIICNLNQTYTYTIHRNRKCILQPQWILPSNSTIVSQTDTTIQIRFNSFGFNVVKAKLQSCIPVIDSILVQLNNSVQILNLGTDTSICSNSTITLSVPNVFLNYEWNTGNNTNSISVTQPGIYWLKVFDSCNNMQVDTINITPFPTQITIGPDRIKCNSDTVHLNAPPGFLNYMWSNNYNISSLTSQNVIVYPLLDTSYFLKAEKLPGCFAYDTIKIKVNNSPSINLGIDRGICIGDSILLDPGSNFINYLWSTGSINPQIYAKNVGRYFVTATYINNCKSSDTVNVLTLFPKPLPKLDKNQNICIGTPRTLNPGTFSKYLWHDGSTGSTFIVTNIGKYFVTVTDNNLCKNTDTVEIKNIVPIPADFLFFSDTSICVYEKILLNSKDLGFTSFLWNTGSASNAIVVDKPGLYWLQVKDNNQCLGYDSVRVKDKNCVKGIYFPNAFVPKGTNKIYKPIIYESIVTYHFKIFDRYGTPVFETNDYKQGWDGRINGKLQNTNTYIYICSYKSTNGKSEVHKGSFILIN